MLRLVALFLSFLLINFFAPTQASAYDFATKAKQAIAIDVETGTILFEKNADEKMPTSSMSKVMTIYMVFDALQRGQLRLDDTLEVSEKAWKKGGSKMFIEVGDNVKVEDLIKGVIVQSGNDATIALAEGLAGSEDRFASIITAQAKDMGMINSNFMNASGWPDPDHYSTARDLAILAERLITDFPEYYHYYGIEEFEYSGIKQANRNPLIYRNIGADGIKTGHTEDAGYGLIGSGERDGRRVVIVMNGMESSADRAEESAKLLDWSLRNFENVTLGKTEETYQIPVVKGQQETVSVKPQGSIKVTLPRGYDADNIKTEIAYDSPLAAPISKDQQVGTLKISSDDLPETYDIPVVSTEDVKKSGLIKLGFQNILLWAESLVN